MREAPVGPGLHDLILAGVGPKIVGSSEASGEGWGEAVSRDRHGRLESAARTSALGGSDDGARSVAARATEDREGPAWPPEMPEQTGESSVESLQPGDPIGDLCPPILDHPRQLRGRVSAVSRMAPARDPRGILEWQVEAAQVDDQSQVLDIRRAVFSIRVVAPTGPREPPRPLIEAHGVGRDADRLSKFADPHAVSKPWSGSNVKTGQALRTTARRPARRGR